MERKKMLVYNLRDFDEKQYFEQYAEQFQLEIVSCPDRPSMENVHLAEGCTYVNIITTPISAELMECFYNLGVKYIVTRTIGYDHIDLEAAKQYGITVANTPYGPEGVAEYTLMLMLQCVRKYDSIARRFACQDYTLKGLIGKQLSGMTVGIIGAGSIGLKLAELLQGFSCKVLLYAPHSRREIPDYASYVTLEELYAQSDVISLHAPASEETFHMINRDALSSMKDGVILVNTGRGPLIAPNALVDGLESGKVGSVGLDVVENEFDLVYYDRKEEVLHHKDLYLLKSYPNVTITHHMAFYTQEVIRTMCVDSMRGAYYDMIGKENPWKIQ